MGEVFAGRYELVDPIGRGGVGAVWRAWDHRRRRYVAAKVLQQRDAHALLRFVREQALRIDHPHVLAPASWAADDDKVLFTMDLVAGGSLVHLVGDYGPLPASVVCTLLDQLLAGLAAVHAEGVVHRDIKPANILLEATGTSRPRLRLSDFGIAMRLGEPRLTETNLVVGTPGYIAPEQMLGSDPDFPADLFAVGLVALYLLEGAKPDAKALVEYFAAHGTPSAPKGIPEPLWQVVASMLQPDPQARFRTATGARKALSSAVELLPEPGPDDEQIEIFDQLGSLPPGFAPEGPLKRAPGVDTGSTGSRTAHPGALTGNAHGPSAGIGSSPDLGAGVVPPGPRPGGPLPSPDSAVHRSTPAPAKPTTASGAGVASEPISMSDTGSFHLPPPQPTTASSRTAGPSAPPPHPGLPQSYSHAHPQPQARAHQDPEGQSANVSPHDPTHLLSSPRPPAPRYPVHSPTTALHQRVDASTASYTAQAPQVPPVVREAAHTAQPRHRAARRRSGPPAKVTIPLLLLALACYAVGFWALTRI
ncbi:non-specific serine/threonine protein kinase OS=Streptomyces alboniger OX=132473 GN=CP975_17765 PE=4 SV=1 [Streptomyces alboniger]